MELVNEFIFCSLLLWQIGIISYILLNKFYGKNPKKIIQSPVKNLKDFDPAGYVKDANLMPGSGIKKKLPEDWQKKSGKNPEGGLNEKGRKSYERQNPGSDLKRPSKKVGNPRRASFCARNERYEEETHFF